MTGAWTLPDGPTLPVDHAQVVRLMAGRGYTHVLTGGGAVPIPEWDPLHAPARWRGCLIPGHPDKVGDLPDTAMRHVWPPQITAETIVGVWIFLRLPTGPATAMRAVLTEIQKGTSHDQHDFRPDAPAPAPGPAPAERPD